METPLRCQRANNQAAKASHARLKTRKKMKTLCHGWSNRGCCSIATHRILIIDTGLVDSRLCASPGRRKTCSSSCYEPFRTPPAPVDGETLRRNVSQVREDQHLDSAICLCAAVLFSSPFKSFTSRLWRTVANDLPHPSPYLSTSTPALRFPYILAPAACLPNGRNVSPYVVILWEGKMFYFSAVRT